MYKSILAILLVGLLAAPIMAQPYGPIPPAGWGYDCDFWAESGGAGTIVALHTDREPENICDNRGWVVYDELTCDGQAQMYPFLFAGSVELWIELYAQMTCRNTNWRFHRISDGDGNEDVYFWVVGSLSSNSEIAVCVSPDRDLVFQHNIFGNANEDNNDIALSYGVHAASYNDEQPPQDLTTDMIMAMIEGQYFGGLRDCFYVGPCDWWWILVGYGCIPYHSADGYYLLVLTICPTPVM